LISGGLFYGLCFLIKLILGIFREPRYFYNNYSVIVILYAVFNVMRSLLYC